MSTPTADERPSHASDPLGVFRMFLVARASGEPCQAASPGSAERFRKLLTERLRQLRQPRRRNDPMVLLGLALESLLADGTISWQTAREVDWDVFRQALRDARVPTDHAAWLGVRRRRYVGPVVYGLMPDPENYLLFIPRDRAVRIATLRESLQTAATWGEVRARLPEDLYREVVRRVLGNPFEPSRRLSFEQFYARRRRRQPGLSRDAAWRAYAALPPDRRQPLPHEPFPREHAYGYEDWPPHPRHDMLKWIPRAIVERYGQFEPSFLDGDLLQFSPDDEAELVQAFARYGCLCIRDDTLVHRACGYPAEDTV